MIIFLDHLLQGISMNLDQLQAVLTILDKGSFRAAADELHKSQPALSASIKNLEEEFNIQIFDRSDYRPKLTEVGSIFITSARATLEASKQTEKIARELGMKKTETKLRVSLDHLVPIEMIQAMAQECLKPEIPTVLILENTVLQGSHTLLLDGCVDLAIAPYPHDDESIEKIAIKKVTLVPVISKSLLKNKTKIDEQFLKKTAQVFVYNKNFEGPSNDLSPNPIYEGGGAKIYVPDHFSKVSLIKNGLGWGRISQEEFAQAKNLEILDKKICKSLELQLCLMRSKNRPSGPVARKIWERLKT